MLAIALMYFNFANSGYIGLYLIAPSAGEVGVLLPAEGIFVGVNNSVPIRNELR